jgi:hypothetical protein
MQNILENHDFQPEMVGGGSFMLSRYMESGAYIWITGSCGDGLPEENDWLVVAYPAAFDGDYSTTLFELSSSDEGEASLFDAAQAAIELLELYAREDELCRNGVAWNDCQCC